MWFGDQSSRRWVSLAVNWFLVSCRGRLFSILMCSAMLNEFYRTRILISEKFLSLSQKLFLYPMYRINCVKHWLFKNDSNLNPDQTRTSSTFIVLPLLKTTVTRNSRLDQHNLDVCLRAKNRTQCDNRCGAAWKLIARLWHSAELYTGRQVQAPTQKATWNQNQARNSSKIRLDVKCVRLLLAYG